MKPPCLQASQIARRLGRQRLDHDAVVEVLDGDTAAVAVEPGDMVVSDLRDGQLVQPHIAATTHGVNHRVAGRDGAANEVSAHANSPITKDSKGVSDTDDGSAA